MQYFTIKHPKGETKISLPSNWGDVNLGTFQQIAAIKGGTPELNKAIELSILSGQRVEFFKSLPKSIVTNLAEHIGKFLNYNQEFQEIRYFTHNGQKYIVPDWSYNEMTFGEWMDAKTIIKAKEEIESNVFENAHLLIAVLCRKEGQPDYESDEVNEVAEDFKTLPMDVVFSITTFFLQQRKGWLKNMDIFLTHLSNLQTEDKNTLVGSDFMARLLTLLPSEDLSSQTLQELKALNVQNLESV